MLSQLLEEKLKAAGNKQANSEAGFVVAQKESANSQRLSDTVADTVNSLWQVADKLLPQPTRVSISHACKLLTNGPKGGADEADGDGFVVAGSHVVANSQLAVFRLPLLQLQPNCCDGNLFQPAAAAAVAASCDAVCCT